MSQDNSPEADAPQSDFRYDTGEAKVPWAAVGETFSPDDAVELLKFLFRPGSDQAPYNEALERVAASVRDLGQHASPASKLSLGDEVARAEAETRELLGVKHACLLTNWTAGMEISYKLAGLQPGDEVIVPAITFIASMGYPLACGAKVVFGDVDPATVNLDPDDVARKITPRTKVIMPVHIGGAVCDMDPIMELARQHDIYVIEDAAHAFGAKYKGQFAGAIGHFGGYSLHEVKNINSLGEGGVLVTNLDLGEQFARARFLGVDPSRTIPNWLYDITPLTDRYGHVQIPGNHSVTEIQAVAYLLQLARLDAIIAERRRTAEYLSERFQEEEGILTPTPDTADTYSTHHLYLLRIDPDVVGGDIQGLKTKLADRGVTQIQHFGPLYKFSIIADLGYDQDAIAASCPNTEEAFARQFTHLPLYGLSREQCEYLADAVIASVHELKAGK